MHYPSITKMNIYKKLHEARKAMIHKINPGKYQYTLKMKTPKLPISRLKEYGLEEFPKGVETFTIADIGKRSDKNYYKSIVTFYKNNQIAIRIICEKNSKTKTRVYTTQKAKIDSGIKYIHRTIKTFVDNLAQNNNDLNKIENIEIIKHPKFGRIKFTMHKDENIFNGSVIKAKLQEYTSFALRKTTKHNIDMDIKIDTDGIPKILKKSASQGISLSEEKDKFLAYRFIFDNSAKRMAFTNYFLKKYRLDKLGIKIDDTKKLPDDNIGYFCVDDRQISYDKDTAETIEIAAHEARHAYQYAQIGRLGKGYGKYYRDCEKQLGAIKDIKEQAEAYKFYEASRAYPTDEEILTHKKLYSENYLELDAQKAESEARQEYMKGARILSAQLGRFLY